MVFMIGGAYQGKLALAKKAFSLQPEDIFICNGPSIDFSKKCIYKIEEFARHCDNPVAYFAAHAQQWQESIFIMDDIFCGVVPMGAQRRAWRQSCGRLSQYLAGEAAQVSRVFCGLELRLK